MSLHVLYGTDEYRRSKALNQLRETYLTGDFITLNHHVLKKPKLNPLLENITTASFSLMGQPMIEVHNFYAFQEAEADKTQLDYLVNTIAEQAEHKHIIFVTEKADKKLKFTKSLLKLAICKATEYKVPVFWDSETALQLLKQECDVLGIHMEPNAQQLLVEHLGHELGILVPECQKLFLYTKGQLITVPHVQQVCQLNQDNFYIIEQWLNSSVQAHLLQDLKALLSHTAPLPFLALMHTLLNYHYRIKRGLALGHSLEEIARQEGKKTYPLQKDAAKLRKATLQSLELKRQQLIKAELAIKTGQQPEIVALESLLLGAMV